nr:hypothetical protein GCM10010200_084930 [Actinomadura rugatobispora]
MTHFGEGAPARGLDDAQGVQGLLGAGLRHVDGDTRLDRDEAHAVRDDIVQLAGYAEAFVGDGLVGELAG